MAKEQPHRSRHHIEPLSKGGIDKKGNIAIISRKLHEKYHSLFENRTPAEILDFLVEYFWDGDDSFVYEFLNKTRY